MRVVALSDVDIATGLEDGDTLNGVTLATGDRVLLTGQTSAEENGAYVVVASGAASRSTDLDQDTEAVYGLEVPVVAGDLGELTTWVLTTTGAITIGTTALTFERKSTGRMALGFFFGGLVTADEERRYIFTVNGVLPAGLTASQVHVGVNPSTTRIFDVQRDGVSIGGISMTSGGVVSFTGDIATQDHAFTAGQILALVAPDTISTLADVTISLELLT